MLATLGPHVRTTSTYTAWKVSKYGVFSGPYFSAFGLNTERYGVSLRIQSECGKMQTRITPNTDTFYAVLPFLYIKTGFYIKQFLGANTTADDVAKLSYHLQLSWFTLIWEACMINEMKKLQLGKLFMKLPTA